MPEIHKPVRVAINVMRARLTVIGFNIAIVSYQIAQIRSGGVAGNLLHKASQIQILDTL